MRVFDTPFGRMAVAATAKGLARVLLPTEAAALLAQSSLRQVSGVFPEPRPCVAAAFAVRAEREILQYLAGRRRKFTVPVDLSAVPPFHARVLRALAHVPYGRTVTYSALAARVGRPHGARAVGQAMARNPVPLVLPCHRVVACGGGLGGFGGGVALKRWLLDLEGAG
jgi:methylated-DNA-[protein]-cysteine S-methyltransferase